MEDEIMSFIDSDVSDNDLPLHMEDIDGEWPFLKNEDEDKMQSLLSFVTRRWRGIEKEFFLHYQWRFTVPFFEIDQHYDFAPEVILPFLQLPQDVRDNGYIAEGGFATVESVRIDAASHNFQGVLDRVSLQSPSPYQTLNLMLRSDGHLKC